jgi:hypothetical protein
MPRKEKKEDDLDTQTTIVDMNVEGFRWYDPSAKKGNKSQKRKVSRKEYWQLVRAAFAAYLPYFAILILSFGIVVVLAYLWLT